MSRLSRAAKSIGFESIAARISWHQLQELDSLPVILHWNQNHFVVLYKIEVYKNKHKIYISDPGVGLCEYSEQDFLKSWCNYSASDNPSNVMGVVLLLEPRDEFYSCVYDIAGRSRSNMIRYVLPHSRLLGIVSFTIIIASVFTYLLPKITSLVVDKGINNKNLSLILLLLIAQMIIVLVQLFNNMVKSWVTQKLSSQIGLSIITDFIGKLMRLPMSFFEKKKIGDIMQRVEDQKMIQYFLTTTLLSIVMAIISLIIYGVLLAKYNLAIIAIFFFGSALYVFIVLILSKSRKILNIQNFQMTAQSKNSITQILEGMHDIKLNCCENYKEKEWKNIQHKLIEISFKILRLEQKQMMVSTFIEQTKNSLISFISASLVVKGEISIGVMFAIQYIIGQLNAPISQFVQFIQTYQNASFSMERVDDVLLLDDESDSSKEYIDKIPPLSDIILDNIYFRYDSTGSECIFNGLTIKIPYGKITAIVGESGTGKTTLVKLILGLCVPDSGRILIGNNDLSEYNPKQWRKSCAAVMQDGYIFSDTIAMNISSFDTIEDIARIKEAAAVANIDTWVSQLPLGYDTVIGMDGSGVSTGQKQRLLIARAVYKRCDYVFLDEATNALDATNEMDILDKLKNKFKNKTIVIVAHRLNTIRKADKIIVLNSGKVVEEGTHESLYKNKSYYYNLFSKQIQEHS